MCRKRARPSASTSVASRPISWSPPPRAATGDSATAAEEEAGDKDSGKLLTGGLLLGVRVGGWRKRSGFQKRGRPSASTSVGRGSGRVA